MNMGLKTQKSQRRFNQHYVLVQREATSALYVTITNTMWTRNNFTAKSSTFCQAMI